jgi:hypothetical protein
MPSLRELQQNMSAALFDGASGSLAALVLDEGIGAEEGLGIYRNNLREGFRKTLALEFPVIERLVGEDYFRQLVLEFQAAEPSRNGDLHHVGAPFAAFLQRRFAGTEYAYFADVAALEWAHCEVLVAADSDGAGLEALAAIPPERYGDLRFSLAPSARLLRSPFPVVRIWQANQPQAPATETLDLASGATNVLVRRGPTEVEFHLLDDASFALAAALAGGATLEAAFEEAQRADAAFDLGASLKRLVGLGVLVAPALR